MTHDESYLDLCCVCLVAVGLAVVTAAYGYIAGCAILACIVSAGAAVWKLAQKGELEE